MADYARWYRVGTVALTKNSKIVTGTGTFFLSAGLNPGDLFTVDASQFYEVSSIDSNTQITLKTAYLGTTTAETDYSIVRNFTASLPAQVAAQTADLLNDFRRFVDMNMQSIHGKSAYQIACEKGYVGTESEWVRSLEGASAYEVAVANGYNGTAEEWLEALKAAGEWADADSRLDALEAKTMRDALINDESITLEQRNAIFGGRNLGVFTEDHYDALKNHNGKGLAVGDYFHFPEWDNKFMYWGCAFRIVGFKTIIPDKASMALIPDYACAMGTWAKPYSFSYNSAAIGTEGEEGYVPSTLGNCYPESNWYVNVRPKFIEWCETQFLGHLLEFEITVPAAQTGGVASALVNLSSKAHLPTLDMVYGQMHSWTRNYLETHNHWGNKMYEEFPLYQIAPWFRFPGGGHTPLMGCAESGFSMCSTDILNRNYAAVHNSGSLRPVICIG